MLTRNFLAEGWWNVLKVFYAWWHSLCIGILQAFDLRRTVPATTTRSPLCPVAQTNTHTAPPPPPPPPLHPVVMFPACLAVVDGSFHVWHLCVGGQVKCPKVTPLKRFAHNFPLLSTGVLSSEVWASQSLLQSLSEGHQYPTYMYMCITEPMDRRQTARRRLDV